MWISAHRLKTLKDRITFHSSVSEYWYNKALKLTKRNTELSTALERCRQRAAGVTKRAHELEAEIESRVVTQNRLRPLLQDKLDLQAKVAELEAEVRMYEAWFNRNATVLATHRIGGYHFSDAGKPCAVLCSPMKEASDD